MRSIRSWDIIASTIIWEAALDRFVRGIAGMRAAPAAQPSQRNRTAANGLSLPALLFCAAMVASASQGQAAIIVHNSDFIPDANRTNFNGFESIPTSGVHYSGGNGPYTEDSISVQQVNGDGAFSTWVTYNWPGRAGNYSWYPDGGDNGYTQISLSGGADFQNVGFNYGTGGSPSAILYELYDDGNVVLSGTAALTAGVNYLGFSGGGFDTIRVRDALTDLGGPIANGVQQALAIDSIEVVQSTVPEPGTFALVVSGMLGLAAARRRRPA